MTESHETNYTTVIAVMKNVNAFEGKMIGRHYDPHMVDEATLLAHMGQMASKVTLTALTGRHFVQSFFPPRRCSFSSR